MDSSDIIKQATKEISERPDMFSDLSIINSNNIDDSIIDSLSDADYSASSRMSASLNDNDVDNGSLKDKKDNKPKTKGSIKHTKQKDPIETTKLRIQEAIRKIPNLIYVSYDYAFNVESVYDIANCNEISIVYEMTGLTTRQWCDIIKVIDVCKLNRRIDAYVHI